MPKSVPLTLGSVCSTDLLELVEYRRVLQCRDVLFDLLALGERAQEPAHDLARTGLGQVVTEADILGFGDRADFLGDPVAQFIGDLAARVAGRPRLLEH